MKRPRELLYWLPLLACVAIQLMAAMADYSLWLKILPDQMLMLGITACIVLPVLFVNALITWLLSFRAQDRKGLLWNCVRAKILYFGLLSWLICFFSIIGGMMTWRNDYPWGIISFLEMVVLPPALAFVYEYRGGKKLLPGASKGDIIGHIVLAAILAVAIVVLLIIVILLLVFPLTILKTLAG